jgi:hypothetical protein
MGAKSKPPKIKFTDYHLPSLPNGEYILSVSQQLSDAENKIKTQPLPEPVKRTFYVAGERFYINPKQVAAVFPPASALGAYHNVFPHIMINLSTLPWERRAATGDKETPWLSLLVIYEDEEVKSRVMKLNDIIKAPGTQQQVKAALNIAALEPGQSEEDKIQVLQIKKTLLEKTLPSAVDLRYLAHIRTNVDDAGNALDSEKAVIIGGRLPEKGKRSTVYLVSVENRLKNGKFDYSVATDDVVSLLQLYSWSFTCTDQGDFTTIIKHLNRKASTLNKPGIGVKHVDKYLRKGFYPLPHKLIQGAQTVSWYHGPLGTGNIKFKTSELKSNADSLLCYDAENGLIDVSYAAAWEMGRLLALQNIHFSTELYKWKHQYTKARYLAEQSLKFPHLITANRDNTPATLPGSVCEWLYDLSLLTGVPFNYLVPDEELLPTESIRFFKLDQAWIYALQNGSLSIGSVGGIKNHEPESKIFIELADYFKEKKGTNLEMVSGFLLRSEGVSGWPAMQIAGYSVKLKINDNADPGDQLRVLRNTNLSPNVKLCFFDGELKTLSIGLKAESLHFGVDESDSGYSKKWRNKDGSEVEPAITIEIKDGILNLTKLISAYKTKDPQFASSAHLALQLLEGVDEVRWTV